VWAADALFRDETDRLTFLRELARTTGRTGWSCIAFCLMGTHYHLILDVAAGALPKGMHYLNFRYATWFNDRHGTKGHVHGRRYGARRIRDEADLLGVVKYAARNPVKAGLCERPEDWRWSSYAGTVGLSEQHSFVDDRCIINSFDAPIGFARAALRRYVDKS